MEPRFIQYEIRYSPILNFAQYYKDIVAKYLALDDATPNIANFGMFDEHIVMVFLSSYHIDYRLDRLIFRYEGDHKLIYNSSGATKFFFDILDETRKLKAFGKVKQTTIQIKAVGLLEHSNKLIVEKFKSKFFQQSTLDSILTSTDVAITIDRAEGAKYSNLIFGPFETQDIAKQGISPLKSDFNKDLNGNGLMCSYTVTEKTDKSSFSFFKDTLVEMISVIQNIKIE
ncbi:MAG: hypothetical protein AABY93_14265 [Bacteroidota bacterium]